MSCLLAGCSWGDSSTDATMTVVDLYGGQMSTALTPDKARSMHRRRARTPGAALPAREKSGSVTHILLGSSGARRLRVSIGAMMRLPRDADAVPEARSVETSELLKQLRIDRSAPDIPHSRARRFVLVGSVLVVLAGSLCWFALTRPGPPTVRTAMTRFPFPVMPSTVYEPSTGTEIS